MRLMLRPRTARGKPSAHREVADELVVSIKTINYHLANVYSNLGVHSRVQLLKAWGERTD